MRCCVYEKMEVSRGSTREGASGRTRLSSFSELSDARGIPAVVEASLDAPGKDFKSQHRAPGDTLRSCTVRKVVRGCTFFLPARMTAKGERESVKGGPTTSAHLLTAHTSLRNGKDQLRHDGEDDDEGSSPIGTHSRFCLAAGAGRSSRRPSMLLVGL